MVWINTQMKKVTDQMYKKHYLNMKIMTVIVMIVVVVRVNIVVVMMKIQHKI